MQFGLDPALTLKLFLVLLSILISILTQASFQQTSFEYFVFISFPQIRIERSRLSTNQSVKLVINEKADPEQMDEKQLYKLTRRAFSNYGDLQRLSANRDPRTISGKTHV